MNNMDERLTFMQTALLAISTRLRAVEETLMPTKNEEIIHFLDEYECEFLNFKEQLKETFDNRDGQNNKEYTNTVTSLTACIENIEQLRQAARNNGKPEPTLERKGAH